MFHFELETTIRRQIHAQHEKLSRLEYFGAFLKNSYYYTTMILERITYTIR